jgi:hypothetical protein
MEKVWPCASTIAIASATERGCYSVTGHVKSDMSAFKLMHCWLGHQDLFESHVADYRYDATGRTDEKFADAEEMGWDAYFGSLYQRVDKKMIDEDMKKYQGE